jgi:hypothetical protein
MYSESQQKKSPIGLRTDVGLGRAMDGDIVTVTVTKPHLTTPAPSCTFQYDEQCPSISFVFQRE